MLENDIRNSESVSAFKRQILKFNRQSPNSPNTFNNQNPHEIKLLTRVGLGHLHEQKLPKRLSSFATTVGTLKQLLTSFSTAQIIQIKEKSFLRKLVTSSILYSTKMLQL